MTGPISTWQALVVARTPRRCVDLLRRGAGQVMFPTNALGSHLFLAAVLWSARDGGRYVPVHDKPLGGGVLGAESSDLSSMSRVAP